MKNTQVLSLKNLSKRFGSVVANNSVNIELYRGEVLSLLGENGAGKTTLMNMLFGHYLPDSGSIDVLGNDGQMRKLVLGHPQASLDAGIGMVHQHFTLAENLTVLDNILLGSEKLWAWRHDRNKARNKILKIIDRTGLSAPLDEKVARLTVGERQRVEILKALYHEVKILVLDEPTAVLTPQEADALFENIDSMTKDGLSVIFISHKLREVLKFSNRIAVLRHGEKVGEIATSDANERVIARMMVGEETIKNPIDKIQLGNPILQLNEVSVKGDSMRTSLNRTNFTIHENEIVGIAGVSGNGQSVLAKLISGLIDPDSGELLIEGENVEYFSPNGMQSLGVGRIPEDRHHDGVVGAMSVAENLVIERLQDRDVNKNGFLQNRAIKENAETLIEKYDIRGPGIDAKASLLSGGNIQKLILARVFECKPNVILANQPTRGLDLGAANEVARHLLEARGRGAGVLLISEDLDEILALSDRIMVIHNGSLIETVNKDREVIGLMMAGEKI